MPIKLVGCTLVLAMGASVALAQGTPEPSRFSITPHLGVVSESDLQLTDEAIKLHLALT